MHAEPAEAAQLDDAALAFVDLRKGIKRVAQRDNISCNRTHHRQILTELDFRVTATAFLIFTTPTVIDQDPPHDSRRDGEEVGAILPLHLVDADETHVCFVDQGSGLQGVIGALPMHIPARDTPQFDLDKLDNAVERLAITLLPRRQQSGYVLCLQSLATLPA